MASQDFYQDIKKFNDIYKLPNNDSPTLLGPERVDNFRDILMEEVHEAEEIHDKYKALLEKNGGELAAEDKLHLLTDMSDWLGDIVVYCASEARRWGLPMEKILEVIMQSNFSKLDENGKPIYDERGKVMKGPSYWKPEPKISELLKDK